MDKKTVKHIAKLSNFNLSDEQLNSYTKDLTDICEILDMMKTIDVQGVDPMVSPLNTDFKSREDVCQNQDHRDTFDQYACEVIDDYFMVPQVIK